MLKLLPFGRLETWYSPFMFASVVGLKLLADAINVAAVNNIINLVRVLMRELRWQCPSLQCFGICNIYNKQLLLCEMRKAVSGKGRESSMVLGQGIYDGLAEIRFTFTKNPVST